MEEDNQGKLRIEITAELVREAEWLLLFGIGPAEIAARLGITEYVVKCIASMAGRKGTPMPPRKTERRVPGAKRGTDFATIRRIQRMLAIDWLTHREIAREAGVSPALVDDIASGSHALIATAWIPLAYHEKFVAVPVRCAECSARISIVPCRACRAKRWAQAVQSEAPTVQ